MQQESPALRGEVHNRDRPVAGVKVTLAVNIEASAACVTGSSTLTDATGAFAFAKTSYFTPVVVFGDRRDEWTLCFDGPDNVHFQWSDHGWWGGPPLQRLSCDLGRDAVADDGAAPAIAGCHAVILD